jgi:hypothetical protein
MTPFDVYKTYLSLKNHFTKDNYDYHKYCGKTRASLQSFYKRKDRYWFEKLGRQKSDNEIVDFFVANFASSGDADSLWIGEMIRGGESVYNNWKKKKESLTYVFKEETTNFFTEHKFEEVFDCSKGHPPLLKKFLNGKISMETMVIYDRIFLFGNSFDKKLKDPVWQLVSKNIKKYSPFLNIDIFKFKKILRECLL